MSDMTSKRERIVRWEDPMTALRAANQQGMPGIEFLRAILAGELPAPPMAELMGMKLTLVEEGRAIFAVEPAEYHYNPIGVVHGGLAATMLDSAMGCAIQSLAPAGVGYTTLELKVNFVRALYSGMGTVFAEGTVLHFGRQVALAEAKLTDADNKLLGHATSTCLIIRTDASSRS